MFPFVRRRSASSARIIVPMKNPARKRANRHFRAELAEYPNRLLQQSCRQFSLGINCVLPGLTCCRTFHVISFANCLLFCIGKTEGSLSTRNRIVNSSLLPLNRLIEYWFPLRRRRNLNPLDRLNAAHFDFNIDPLWWPGKPAEPH